MKQKSKPVGKSTRQAEALLPLKPLVFQILLVLHDGERHGYSIVKQLAQEAAGRQVAPGNLYRTLRGMLAQNLIEESDHRPDPALDDQRRRYFRLTATGRRVARAEADRLEGLLSSARRRRLFSGSGGPR